MNNSNLELALKIKALVEGAQNLVGLIDEVHNLGEASQQTEKQAKGLDQAFDRIGIRSAGAIQADINRINTALIQMAGSAKVSGTEYARAAEAGKQKIAELERELAGASRETANLAGTVRNQLGPSLDGLKSGLTSLIGLGALQQFVGSSMQEFARAESGFRGLEAVARHAGIGIGAAMAEAEKLAADGLITVQDAAKGLQNLISRGYSLDQAIQTLNRLKDAAAFNRAAQLSLGEAIVTASEGLKNENSVLVDNAGVTKNVSVLWKEYAEQIGKSVNDLTQQEKIQAEVNGILRETEAQLGNAAKAAAGYQGEVAKADSATRKFKASIGEALAPAVSGLAQAGVWMLDHWLKPLVAWTQTAGIGAGFLARSLGHLIDLLKTRDSTAFFTAIDRDAWLAEEALQRVHAKAKSGTLDFAASATASTQAVATQVGKDQQAVRKSLEETKKAYKEAVKERVADYGLLQQALEKALDDNLKTEKDYLARAKQLRAQADQRPVDTSIEGQASATLDLIYAQEKLLRLQTSNAPLDQVQAQAEAVRALSGRLTDQARAREAQNQAALIEAKALEQAAKREAQQQAGLKQQIDATRGEQPPLGKEADALIKEERKLTITGDFEEIRKQFEELKTDLAQLAKGVTVPIRYNLDQAGIGRAIEEAFSREAMMRGARR